MRLFDSLRRYLHSLFGNEAENTALHEELEFHFDSLVDRNVERGMSPAEARIAARAEFGGMAEATQATYESRGTALLDDFVQDIRYGLRSLRRQPGFTIVTALTLALGIGACTAVYSLVNAVMLRSLPYGDASRLVYLYTPNPHLKEIPPEALGPSNADFFDIRAQSHSFSTMTFFDQKVVSLSTAAQTERIGAAKVDSSFFRTLEVAPLFGREFTQEDEQPGNGHVVLVSYSLWQSLFAGAADVLNRSLILDGTSYRIAGVMPPDFGYPHRTDLAYGKGEIETTQLWVPDALTPQQRAEREDSSIFVLARLRPGVTVKDAQAEMSTIVSRLAPLHKGLIFQGMTALVKPLDAEILGPVRPLMMLLLAAVGFVLLIACGNAANLLLARAADRRHELGVRATLGARRGRLLRQMLTESLLLGAAAGVAGIALAVLFLRVLVRLNPSNIPHMETASLDLQALVFLLLISFVTSIVFGILPALSVMRINVAEFLSAAGTRGLVADRRRLRRALVSAQVALVVVLLTGAGLFLRSYLKVLSVPTGFSPSTIGVSVNLPAECNTREKRQALYTALLERVRAQHGVEAAGMVNYLPLTDSESLSTLLVEGYPNRNGQMVESRAVTSGYFTAMQTPLIAGRTFTSEEDSPGSHRVSIVNQAFAKRYFDSGDPLGRHLRMSTTEPWSTVVGVVQDIRNISLEEAAAPQIYEPSMISGNLPSQRAVLAVRSSLPKDVAISDLRAVIRSVDPGVAISGIHGMSDLTAHASAPRRFQTTLLTGFSFVALLLATVGVYGLLAYSVRQRTGEIGLRMALGSSRAGIARLILGEGLSLLVGGLLIGIAGALVFAHLLRGFLYEVPPLDSITFAVVPILLILATLAACLIPSARAAATDPMEALRHE